MGHRFPVHKVSSHETSVFAPLLDHEGIYEIEQQDLTHLPCPHLHGRQVDKLLEQLDQLLLRGVVVRYPLAQLNEHGPDVQQVPGQDAVLHELEQRVERQVEAPVDVVDAGGVLGGLDLADAGVCDQAFVEGGAQRGTPQRARLLGQAQPVQV